MSDSQLRELERRWRETGSVEDEARYLLERVRVGDLEQEKLELAAYCGHEGARLALPRAQTGPLIPEQALASDPWVLGLSRFGKEALLRAAIAGARESLPQLGGQCLQATAHLLSEAEGCLSRGEASRSAFTASLARAIADEDLHDHPASEAAASVIASLTKVPEPDPVEGARLLADSLTMISWAWSREEPRLRHERLRRAIQAELRETALE